MAERIISIGRGGRVTFIYDDTMQGLLQTGKATVKRASHVEPFEDGSGWYADMSPVGGPMLDNGGKGFQTRELALEVEVEWLNENYLNASFV